MTTSLRQRASARFGAVGAGVYAAVLSILILALAGTVGLLTHLPWLFPSLGPTVMLFFESPEQPSSRPVNTVVGHAVGIAVGLGCLFAFGLSDQEPATVGGLTPMYVLAGAASVALTTLLLTSLRLPHPPAGASTLIVSLGILRTPPELLAMLGAVILITVAGWSANVLLGTRPASSRGRM